MDQDRMSSTHTFPVSSALSDSEDSRRPARTANFHYARMRCAEQAARSISVRRSVGSIPAGELETAKTVQTSYYLLAAAHRQAAHRVERGQRLRNRLSDLLFPLHRAANKVRRFRNQRRAVSV